MNTEFDAIIWGPSLKGIKEAVEYKQSGKNVVLAGKFGFPGGKATESLASLFPASFFKEDDFYAQFYQKIENLKYGILFKSQQWVLFHPEAVKRVCWQMLTQNNVEPLFHVLPLKVNHDNQPQIKLFGREGEFLLSANEIKDCSDDKYLDNLKDENTNRSIIINALFVDSLPADLPGFHVIRRLEAEIGEYVSISYKNIHPYDVERKFNRELDRLSKESWRKFNARILMVPVYPEIRDI